MTDFVTDLDISKPTIYHRRRSELFPVAKATTAADATNTARVAPGWPKYVQIPEKVG